MAWIGCAGLLFAACGGGGGGSGGSGIDPRLARLDVYEAQKLRVLGGGGVMGMAITDPAAIPASGSVDFAGFATIRVAADLPLVLFGDAAVSVAFDTADANGRIGAVFGNDSSGQVVDYDGTITLAGSAQASAVQLGYAGVLTGPADTLVFDGAASGQFLGTPIAAIALSDLDAPVIHNGQPGNATLLIVGEVAQ